MKDESVSSEEYTAYFSKLNNLRQRIVNIFPLQPHMDILDLATGYGYCTIECSEQ